MDSFDHLQQILGTSKKNPVFSVSRHTQTNNYHVYYGMELFDVVPCDHEDTRFKLMVAHLHNVGVKFTQLSECFQVDRRTVKKWSAALKSGDAEKLARALAGRQCGRKLTPAAEAYVRIRFPSIYAENRHSYSRKIREELKEVLKIEVSGETLRPLFGELKARFETGEREEGESGEQSATPDPAESREEQDPCEPSAPEAGSEGGAEAEERPESGPEPRGEIEESAKPCEAIDGDGQSADRNRKSLVDKKKASWCSHLGVLLFSEPLNRLREALGPENGAPVCQWASQVLMGAVNLEQTKLQSREDLSLILGGGLLGSPDHQRRKLSDLAEDPDLVGDILRWNFDRVGGEKMSDFYFDPHTKHYTGRQKVLKGWCAKIRWADKVMHNDFVHSAEGHPIYLQNTDNFEDMRQRFKRWEGEFRQCFQIGEERELTWVIDRGIYSGEIFQWVLDSPNRHLITWEKGYERGSAWPEGERASGSMKVERVRNHKGDKRIYRFEWIEQAWSQNPGMRRIIVRGINPEGNQIEASILTDDLDRPTEEIVWLMFNRWIQENDFKYLDEHFGLNQITSYLSETYAQIRDELEDREVKSAVYAALERDRREEKGRMGKLLLRQRESERKQAKRAKEIAAMEANKSPSREQRQQLGRLKGAENSARRHTCAREQKIEEIQVRIDRLEREMDNTDKEVSRLESLIDKGAVRLCGNRKQLMDVIKITARNLFYEMFAPFKESYDNFRDDHVWFRHFTRSGGIISPAEKGVARCHLIGDADLPKPVAWAFGKWLAQFNQSAPQFPDGSGHRIELVLGSKSAIELATTEA